MSFRYYDVLEETMSRLDEWRHNDAVSKYDVLDSVRERILMLMTHVITTPLIGTAYAYPGDIQSLETWITSSSSTAAIASSRSGGGSAAATTGA
jgi:hypothetical protein